MDEKGLLNLDIKPYKTVFVKYNPSRQHGPSDSSESVRLPSRALPMARPVDGVAEVDPAALSGHSLPDDQYGP